MLWINVQELKQLLLIVIKEAEQLRLWGLVYGI